MALTLRWGLLWTTLPLFMIASTGSRNAATANAPVILLLLFGGYAAISLWWTPNGMDGVFSVSLSAILLLAILLGQRLGSGCLPPMFRAAAFGILINSAFLVRPSFHQR